MSDAHIFEARLKWPATAEQPRPPEAVFSRNNIMHTPGKHEVAGSAPAVYGGDPARYNPEELLLMSLSECHMLTYLAVAAKKRMTMTRTMKPDSAKVKDWPLTNRLSGVGPRSVRGSCARARGLMPLVGRGRGGARGSRR